MMIFKSVDPDYLLMEKKTIIKAIPDRYIHILPIRSHFFLAAPDMPI
jgi:hypothetical protein